MDRESSVPPIGQSGHDDRTERGLEDLPEEDICGVADALQSGDTVYVNSRVCPLTVTDREEQLGIEPLGTQSPDYPYRIVWLSGNGTRYRLRYSHQGTTYPYLHTEGDLKTVVYREEPRIEAKYHTGESVKTLYPGVVSTRSELTEWVLNRLITEKADAD